MAEEILNRGPDSGVFSGIKKIMSLFRYRRLQLDLSIKKVISL